MQVSWEAGTTKKQRGISKVVKSVCGTTSESETCLDSQESQDPHLPGRYWASFWLQSLTAYSGPKREGYVGNLTQIITLFNQCRYVNLQTGIIHIITDWDHQISQVSSFLTYVAVDCVSGQEWCWGMWLTVPSLKLPLALGLCYSPWCSAGTPARCSHRSRHALCSGLQSRTVSVAAMTKLRSLLWRRWAPVVCVLSQCETKDMDYIHSWSVATSEVECSH